MTSLSTLVNQCLLPAYGGAAPTDWLKRDLDDGLAGIVLFGANLDLLDGRIAEVVTAPLRASWPDMIVALDEEGGDITRAEYHRGSNYPGNLALGVVDDPTCTADVASAIAADLIGLGVTVNLGPCVDVCPGFHMPVLGARSFSPDPTKVAEHARSYIEGVQRLGVAATAKHFPGLGSTTVDSHFDLPTIDDPEELVRTRDMVPFEASVRAGVRAVMTGHVRVGSMDSAAATFSRRFVTDILRGELDFDGVVISDALDMAPARAGVGFAGAAVRALRAGVDLMILGPQDGEQTCREIRDGVRAAVEDGSLPLSRLEEAAQRVAALRSWCASPRVPDTDLGGVGLDAARRAVEIRGELSAADSWHVVELRPTSSISHGSVPWGLIRVLDRLAGMSGGAEVGEESDVRDMVLPADVPLAVVVRVESVWSWQGEALAEVLRLRPGAVVVDMGYRDAPVPAGAVVLKTYGAALVNTVAAAELLLGRKTEGAPRDWW